MLMSPRRLFFSPITEYNTRLLRYALILTLIMRCRFSLFHTPYAFSLFAAAFLQSPHTIISCLLLMIIATRYAMPDLFLFADYAAAAYFFDTLMLLPRHFERCFRATRHVTACAMTVSAMLLRVLMFTRREGERHEDECAICARLLRVSCLRHYILRHDVAAPWLML